MTSLNFEQIELKGTVAYQFLFYTTQGCFFVSLQHWVRVEKLKTGIKMEK